MGVCVGVGVEGETEIEWYGHVMGGSGVHIWLVMVVVQVSAHTLPGKIFSFFNSD